MTPEERAKACIEAFPHDSMSYDEGVALIEAAIRAAENDIIERVAKRILRIKDVLSVTSLGRSTIYEMITHGSFPAPVKLGEKAVGWFESEIIEWQKSLPRAEINTHRLSGWHSDDTP